MTGKVGNRAINKEDPTRSFPTVFGETLTYGKYKRLFSNCPI